jgi:hypothetical protein
MRFMLYDAYFNGNKGVSLFGTRTIKDRQYYEMVHRLLAEMRSLSGMLSQAKLGKDMAQDSNPNVRVATCTLDGKIYYGILNKEPKTNSVTFPADRNLVVYREERQLPVQDGKITATLRPHEVIICGADPLPPPVYSAPAYDSEQEALGNPTFDILRFENALAPDPLWALFYHGKAKWIWDKDLYKISGSSVILTKKISLDKVPASAKLLATCDDLSEIWLNGQLVGQTYGWSAMKEFDIANMLRAGENEFVVMAADTGGVCGFLAELQADGQVVMVTDGSWKARATIDNEKPGEVKDNDLTNLVLVVTPYGGDPWGDRIELPRDSF